MERMAGTAGGQSGVPGRRLRELLAGPGPLVAPGTSNALFARMIADAGFDAVYLSGAGVANWNLGRPDIGLVTMTEMVEVARNVCAAVAMPVIADADNGYGGVLNVARTVALYEQAGVAGIQIEDQVTPKRCGHFSGKSVIERQEMVNRVVAALDARQFEQTVIIARTDARQTDGLDEAIERAHLYYEAGADVIFLESPTDEDELARIGQELAGVPLLANMVEGGRTPLIPNERLAELGFKVVIYPGLLTRAATFAAASALGELRAAGTSAGMLDRIFHFDKVNKILSLAEFQSYVERLESGTGVEGSE